MSERPSQDPDHSRIRLVLREDPALSEERMSTRDKVYSTLTLAMIGSAATTTLARAAGIGVALAGNASLGSDILLYLHLPTGVFAFGAGASLVASKVAFYSYDQISSVASSWTGVDDSK